MKDKKAFLIKNTKIRLYTNVKRAFYIILLGLSAKQIKELRPTDKLFASFCQPIKMEFLSKKVIFYWSKHLTFLVQQIKFTLVNKSESGQGKKP